MRLRRRLSLTMVLTAVPVVAGLAWMRADLERRATEQALLQFVQDKMSSGGIERCEEYPEGFSDPPQGHRGPRGGPPPFGDPEMRGDGFWKHSSDPGPRHRGPPDSGAKGRPGPPPGHRPMPRVEIFAYDARFVSANPAAPVFPLDLRKGLEQGQDYASRWFENEGGKGIEIAIRMSHQDTPCAIVLAHRTESPEKAGGGLGLLSGSLILSGAMLLSILIAAGPIVRRVRSLTAQVRKSAQDRYATPVEAGGHDEISALASAFNEASTELRSHLNNLEKREETLRSFVANTTHDVMLPITVLQGHLTLLRNRIDSGAPMDRSTVLDALEEVHYMACLIQNLGAAVKLETAEAILHCHPLSLNELVERVVGRHRPIARQKDIRLDFSVPEPPLWTKGDVTLLEQAVSNVTHNAIRYSEPACNVSLLLDISREDPAFFSLRVIDDGPGISDETLSKLVERSFRTDEARRRHPDGLGLGLHIAKSVAQAHGFELQIRHSEFHGLEVELRGRSRPPGDQDKRNMVQAQE